MRPGRRPERFADRAAAGAALVGPVTGWLAAHADQAGPGVPAPVLVVALPRGGVPVAVPVARAVDAPLDVLLVRKIGVPGQPELAMGAVAALAASAAVAALAASAAVSGSPEGAAAGDPAPEPTGPTGPTEPTGPTGGARPGEAVEPVEAVEVVRNEVVLDRLRIPEAWFRDGLARELIELRRRMRAYRGDRPPPVIRGRTVVVVDDGLATGSTMRAAVAAVRRQHPARVLVAVPVGAADTCAGLRASPDVDDVVCAWCPVPFGSVGQGYRDFRPTTDDEVRAGLAYDLRG